MFMYKDMIDNRRYSSIISDIMYEWKNSTKIERLAMEWISRKIYEKFNIRIMED